MHNDIEKILFSEEQITKRVQEIGKSLSESFSQKNIEEDGIVFLGILKGSTLFLADIIRAFDHPCEMDFMQVSSYGNSTCSSNEINVKKDLSNPIAGKHVVVVEDILDSGLTLHYLIEYLLTKKPASLRIVTLLYKDIERKYDIKCEEIGFICPNEFVVGYGLDYAERYRNLPYVGILKKEVYVEDNNK